MVGRDPAARVSPALFAMKAKLEFIRACHSGDYRSVRRLVTESGVEVLTARLPTSPPLWWEAEAGAPEAPAS